jgi:hypothetical protein
MPKRRVPGHLHRRPRRRDDARPNIPGAPPPLEPAVNREPGSEPPPAATPGGRPPRPTQRLTGPARFVRSAAPPPEVELDYGAVIGDLRQIGILAALAFVVLIVLALVIR